MCECRVCVSFSLSLSLSLSLPVHPRQVRQKHRHTHKGLLGERGREDRSGKRESSRDRGASPNLRLAQRAARFIDRQRARFLASSLDNRLVVGVNARSIDSVAVISLLHCLSLHTPLRWLAHVTHIHAKTRSHLPARHLCSAVVRLQLPVG